VIQVQKKNMRKAFEHKSIGYNFKFTEFQAAVGIAQMRKLRKRMTHKKKMLKLYRKLLSNLPSIEFIDTDLNKITPWMIDILLKSKKQKDSLIEFLKKKNIETRIFYPALHTLPPYLENNKKYKISTDIAERGLWLPSSVSLSEKQIKRICFEINNFLI